MNNIKKNKRTLCAICILTKNYCGEGGIRTRDTLLEYTHFPGVRLQPLGHLSIASTERCILAKAKNRGQNYTFFKITEGFCLPYL